MTETPSLDHPHGKLDVILPNAAWFPKGYRAFKMATCNYYFWRLPAGAPLNNSRCLNNQDPDEKDH